MSARLFKTMGLAALLGWAVVSQAAALSRVYYVDGQTGRDDNAGTSRLAAWKTIDRVNQSQFAPGEQVLFAGGQTFAGTLRVTKEDSGTANAPVIVSSSDAGQATIDSGAADGCDLTGCAFVTVKSLRFVGSGRKNGSDGAGVSLTRTSHVELTDLEVSGFRNAGVSLVADAETKINHVYAHDNGFAGIAAYGVFGGLPRASHLYIGYCRADNNPGDPKNLTDHSGNGIVVGGRDDSVIEYCEASNNGWDMPRQGNGPVGIWGFECHRLTIQHCISHDNKSPGADGGGFDFDGGVSDSVMQYNLSYNNMGCGYLLCQYPGASPWRGNTFRYNISVADGRKSFQSGFGLSLGAGDLLAASIDNNTVINPAHAVASLGDVPRMSYRNNIFVAGADILSGHVGQARFATNLYWKTGPAAALCRDGETVYQTLGDWAAAGQERVGGQVAGRFTDPQLVLPDSPGLLPTDPEKLAAMLFCHPRSGSPCPGAGMPIDGGSLVDLFGRPVNSAHPPLGAGS